MIFSKHSVAIAIIASCFFVNITAFGASCDDYEYREGIFVQDVDGGTKILATGSASVSFDDVEAIKDAREEASMEAKAIISKFLTEEIMSDEKINKVVKDSSSMSGSSRTSQRSSLVERLKVMRNRSSALLRGVVPLGDCYTKAREVRVTVGIKPETIRSAGNLAGGMASSIGHQPTNSGQGAVGIPGAQQPQGNTESSETLRGMDGRSDSERVKSF